MPRLRFNRHWALVLVAGVAIGGWLIYRETRPDHRHSISPVEQGVLYRSGQLAPEALAAEIKRRGIKTVVNLTDHQESEAEICRQTGAMYLYLPGYDCWQMCGCAAPDAEGPPPASAMDLTPLWELLDDPQARPVLIHCTGGVHRTGVAAALYRIEREGWLPQDAIDEMDRYGFHSEKDKYSNVVEYLRSLRPEAEHAAQRTGQSNPR